MNKYVQIKYVQPEYSTVYSVTYNLLVETQNSGHFEAADVNLSAHAGILNTHTHKSCTSRVNKYLTPPRKPPHFCVTHQAEDEKRRQCGVGLNSVGCNCAACLHRHVVGLK